MSTKRFPLGNGAVVSVVVEAIAAGCFVFEVSTSAPGWGGLYGSRPPRHAAFCNAFNATLAGLAAARDYWNDRQVDRLVAAIDELRSDWFDDGKESRR